jgi:hypothetical protein
MNSFCTYYVFNQQILQISFLQLLYFQSSLYLCSSLKHVRYSNNKFLVYCEHCHLLLFLLMQITIIHVFNTNIIFSVHFIYIVIWLLTV